MSDLAKKTTSTVIPGLRYRDALGMIDWLERALGFTRQAVYMAGETTVGHAQMTFGNGMIMLGSADNGSKTEVATPAEVGGRVTDVICLVTGDCAAVYAMAKAAGAEMVNDLTEMEYGGKAFTCRDPEGYVWSVGEYDPWV